MNAGERTIKDITARVRAIADFLTSARPTVTVITVYRADYEALKKWRELAEPAGFFFKDDVPHFGKFKLRTDPGIRG